MGRAWNVVAALKACLNAREVERIHFDAIERGESIHVYLASTLINMYGKYGRMEDARKAFDQVSNHDVVSWNSMIMGYTRNGEDDLALQLYARMQEEGFAPGPRTFVAALKACASLASKAVAIEDLDEKQRCLQKGFIIHTQVEKSECCDSDVFIASALIDMYANCGSMFNARRVFDTMPHHDVVLWNTMIMGYAENGEGDLALELFARMPFQADARTIVAALKACSGLPEKEEGKEKTRCLERGLALHSQIGYVFDIVVANTLVDMYGKCGSTVNAQQVFDRMPLHEVVSWNCIIMGYVECGKDEIALQLYLCMQDKGCEPESRTYLAALKACSGLATKLIKKDCLEKAAAIQSQVAESGFGSNIWVASALIGLYSKCGNMGRAHQVFNCVVYRNVVLWSGMILGYANNGEGNIALRFFARMHKEGCLPNDVTFVAALKACASVAALEAGRAIHAEICKCNPTPYLDTFVASSLVDMYAKCGSMIDAQHVFDSIRTKNLPTWNALMTGYSRQGDTKQVFSLYERMQEERVKADGITFLSLLIACTHSGLVEKGKQYFELMLSSCGIPPDIEHYTCMVDLLGRANRLEEALQVAKRMPFEADITLWMTVLGACRKWGNVTVGRYAFECLLKLNPKDSAAYALMANIYARVGLWEEQERIESLKLNV